MIRVKRIRWAAKMAQNIICRYEIEMNSDKLWSAWSPTFSWRPDKLYKNQQAAKDACHKHYEAIILDLLEDTDGGS